MYLIITDPTLPLLCLSFVAVFLLSQLTNLLGSVMNKYITDTKTRPRDKVAPVKITRRVGLNRITQKQKSRVRAKPCQLF